ATIMLAGLTNAIGQGPELYDKYLDCVILLKANGRDSVTIRDIVSGDYMAALLAAATAEQKLYGFLAALIQGNESPVVFGAETEFYPYLLLQEGNWVLSEGGNYERVDSDWFFNGNIPANPSGKTGGNNPFWFAGAWPS